MKFFMEWEKELKAKCWTYHTQHFLSMQFKNLKNLRTRKSIPFFSKNHSAYPRPHVICQIKREYGITNPSRHFTR